MVNTRRTRFMKKKEGRTRVSQPQEENDVGEKPTTVTPVLSEAPKVMFVV